MKTVIAAMAILVLGATVASAQRYDRDDDNRDRQRIEQRRERERGEEARERRFAEERRERERERRIAEERRERRNAEERRERGRERGGERGERGEFCRGQLRAINQLEAMIASGNRSKGTIIALGDARNSFNSRCR